MDKSDRRAGKTTGLRHSSNTLLAVVAARVPMDQIDRQLWISDIGDARIHPKDHFNTVMTVCQDDICDHIGDDIDYFHFNMSDGHNSRADGECSYEIFEQAASCLLDRLDTNESILIHCHAGISRSVSVSVAAYAVAHDLTYTESLSQIKKNRPEANPNSDFIPLIHRFISNHDRGTVATAFHG